MAKKYNKITREQLLQLFENKEVINRAYICKEYNCSVYSVRQIVDDLIDEKIIKLAKYGYTKFK